ncbi:MAG: hypothetical protein ACI4SR_07365 [Faecalibacillus sp.]
MKKEFNIYEKIMLIGSIIGIIGGFLNLYTVHYISGEVVKVGSMASLDGKYMLIPLIAVIILVLINMEQLSLLAAVINFLLIGYVLILGDANVLSNAIQTVSKGIGWYACVISAFAVLGGAIMNFIRKHSSKS